MLHRNHLSGVDLSNTEFMFLLTCETAGTGYNQTNVSNGTPSTMLEQVISCGVETAIGFTGVTSVIFLFIAKNPIPVELFPNHYHHAHGFRMMF